MTLTKYLGLTLLACLISTSFVTSEYLLNGITNAKSVWFIAVCGLGLIYLAINVFDRSIISFNSLDIAVSVFLIYIIINNVIHDNAFLSRKNVENVALLGTYFFARQLFVDKQIHSKFLQLIFIITACQILVAVLQWIEYLPSYNSNFRISGVFFNPGPYVIFLSAILVYSLAGGLYSKSRIIKITGIALFILALPIIVITLSRSAWIGLIAGILLVAISVNYLKIQFWFKKKLVKTIILSGVLAIISVCAYYLYFLKQDSADGRILIWKLSLNIVKDNLLNGTGQETFSARVIEYQSAYFKQHTSRMLTEGRLADSVYYAFNDILQITVEQGIIGLILFCVVLGIAAIISKRLLQDNKQINIYKCVIMGAIACVVVIIFSGLTAYPLVMLPVAIMFFLSLGILSGIFSSDETIPVISYRPAKKVIFGALMLLGLGLVLYSYALGYAYYWGKRVEKYGYDSHPDAIHKLNRYKLLVSTEEWYVLRQCDYLLNKHQYRQAIVAMEEGKQFTANKALYFSLAELYTYQLQYDKAEQQLKLMYYAYPGLITPKYRLAKFYHNTHQIVKWNKAAREVLNFKPKIVSAITFEMVEEIRNLAPSLKTDF